MEFVLSIIPFSRHPDNVGQWIVTHIAEYFNSTTYCKNYGDLLEAHELEYLGQEIVHKVKSHTEYYEQIYSYATLSKSLNTK